MGEVQKADAVARRKAIVLLLVVAVLGMGLISIMEMNQSKLNDWIETNATTITLNPSAVIAALIVLFAPIYLAARYLFSLGSRIVHAERFPPPGEAVVRDTKIITGDAAIFRGRILQILSVTMAVLISVIMFMVWHLLNQITTVT